MSNDYGMHVYQCTTFAQRRRAIEKPLPGVTAVLLLTSWKPLHQRGIEKRASRGDQQGGQSLFRSCVSKRDVG